MSDLGPVGPGHRADVAWLDRWRLRPDGEMRITGSSTLIPVRTESGAPAMLKIAYVDEEVRGGELLERLHGEGVARVLRRLDATVLLERATGGRDLVRMVGAGHDDDATRVLCEAAGRIHRAPVEALRAPPSPLVDLPTWFRELFAHADELGALHRRGADLARGLLDDPLDTVVLHGDVHHGNVLDFGERGWLAIDPKGLVGERAFDYCNILCNPSHARALAPGRFERQFGVIIEATSLDPGRFASWVVAWCALSSTWFAMDDDPAHADSAAAIGERALALALSLA